LKRDKRNNDSRINILMRKSEDILKHDLTHRLLNFIEEQIKLNEDKFKN